MITETIAIILSVLSIVFSLITYLTDVRYKRRSDTIAAFHILQEEALDELFFHTKGELEEIAKDRRSAEYKDISLYLVRIEHFSVGVNNHLYDLKTVRRLAGELFPGLYEKLEPIIQTKRSVPGAENVFDEFEKLVRSI